MIQQWLDENDVQAWTIKVAAVITAMPRWVTALLRAEGFEVPPEWIGWWLPLSAIMSAGMAIIEGWAFAYVFSAWRNQKGKAAGRLLWLASLSAVLFIAVVTPSISASVTKSAMSDILDAPWKFHGWAATVVAATISIVASVGYAQKELPARAGKATSTRAIAPQKRPETGQAVSGDHICWCGQSFAIQQQLAGHQKKHRYEVRDHESPREAWEWLTGKYGEVYQEGQNGKGPEGRPAFPSVVDVVRWRKK